jgi:cyanophycinase-like exopeptidase
MKKRLFLLLLSLPCFAHSQNYTSYFTGNAVDAVTNPAGGICLMGGATEDDNAMRWFLERADGGDVLVLRASGSNGYNDYLYSDLGVTVNSVETIVCNNANASNDAYVLQKINQAEAIWFAGGDQWNYISYWRNNQVETAINAAIQERNVVMGGTSAGMAIQGQYYFSAQNGTVVSSVALANPFSPFMTVDQTPFIDHAVLQQTITDTHFDSPDRRGRLVAFLARIYTDNGVFGRAIACDEYTAVCIDEEGIARVYGGAPAEDDNAYFVQINCELTEPAPELCTPGEPLTWNWDGLAIKAYRIKGTNLGDATFNLNNWQTGNGGTWLNWSVSNGVFSETDGEAPNCSALSVQNASNSTPFSVFPNPSTGNLTVEFLPNERSVEELAVFTSLGKQVHLPFQCSTFSCALDMSGLEKGVYVIRLRNGDGRSFQQRIVKE